MPIHFANTDFDEQFKRTLSAALCGSADLGEAFATAARITDGDRVSWYDEWSRTADTVRVEAQASLDRGDRVSAREGFLRAAEYHRQAFIYARDDLGSARLADAYAAHRAAFRTAVPLLDEPCTAADIVTDGVRVNGYLLRPDGTGTARPTVILPAGYDSTAEAGYTTGAQAALDRGFNCLTFEGPGQGGVLYEHGLTFRHDYEAVLTPVVDWLVAQPGVDPAGLVLFGRSFAGYLAPRGATSEHRLAALICDPVQYDFAATVRARVGDDVYARLVADDPTLDAELEPLLDDPGLANFYRSRMVTHGTGTVRSYLRELSRFTVRGLAPRITCPTLVLEAEGDPVGSDQSNQFVADLECPATAHRFTEAEGAGGHCEGLGQRRLERVVYGWLATTLHT